MVHWNCVISAKDCWFGIIPWEANEYDWPCLGRMVLEIYTVTLIESIDVYVNSDCAPFYVDLTQREQPKDDQTLDTH